MSIFHAYFIFGLLVLTGGVIHGQTVTSTFDKDYRLSRLNTYTFDSTKRDALDPLATDTLSETKIRDAIDTELQGNGYHPPVEGAKPDFIIAFRVTVKDRSNEQIGKDYVQGSLIVDFYHADTRRLVWRGIATGSAGTDAVDLKLVDDRSEKAAKLLLEQFGKDRIGLIGFWGPIEDVCERWRFIRPYGIVCALSEYIAAT